MKTREQLEVEYKEQLSKLETKETVRAYLATKSLNPSMVHQHKLYGSVGSLNFGESFSRNDNKVTLEQLRDLLRELPPVPTVKAKGTFTRFITESFADSDANKERERESVVSIFPVTLKTNSVADYSVKAEWFTEINGEVWSVDAYLADAWSVAQVSARRVEFRGGFRYENSTSQVNSIFNPPDGGRWEQVRWGRGSDEYPNDFTHYHSQYDDDPVQWIERAIAARDAERWAA